MFHNLRQWLAGKRNGATSGAEAVEKVMRQAVEGPDVEDTQPMKVDGAAVAQSEATVPTEPPTPIQIIVTFEREGSAEFSFHRDHRVSPMMLWPVMKYIERMANLEYDTIILDQKRKASDQEKQRIKIARNLPPILRGKRR